MRETPPVATDLADLGISDGLVAVVKQDCPACQLVVPVFEQLAEEPGLTVYSQDDPEFPEGLAVRDDRELELSYHHDIEAVPTLLRVEEGPIPLRMVLQRRE